MMEQKRRIYRRWFQKIAILLLFGLFNTATAEAQLLAPQITVSTSSTNVSIGDSVTITVIAQCNLGVLTTASCQLNNGSLPVNAVFSILSGVLNYNSTITNTLTITNVSSASAGTYTVKYSDLWGILGLNSSASINLNIIPTIKALTSGTGMIAKGFKLQFSAPAGSNVVVEATSDLNSWSPIYTNVATGGNLSYTDAVATTVSCRFYRARLQ